VLFSEAIKDCIKTLNDILLKENMKFTEFSTRVSKEYLGHLLNSHRNKFFSLLKMNEAAVYILSSTKFLKPKISDDAGNEIKELEPSDVMLILWFLFIDYVKNTTELEFIEDIFLKLYLRREYYYLEHKIKYVAYCPLIQFDMEYDELKINSRMKIRKINNIEKKDLLGINFGISSYFDMIDRNLVNYVIEYKYTFNMEKDVNEKCISKVDRQIKRLITTLRLFKEGSFGFDHIKQYPITHIPMYGPLISYAPIQQVRGDYKILNEEKEALLQLYKKIIKTSIKSHLQLAIDRLNFTYERSRLEDKIIDLSIGYESLFITDEDKRPSDRGYFIGASACMLLGKTQKKREYIKKIIVNGFKLRNDIVHGKKHNKDNLIQLMPKFDQLLKQSIINLL